MIDRTITEEFYIIQTRPDWFQLRLTFNKECISTATTLQGIIDNMCKIAERVQDGDTLKREWKETDFKKSSEATMDYNDKQYKAHKDDFRTEIENAITQERKVNIKKVIKPKKKMLKPSIDLPEIEDDVLDEPITPVKPLKKIIKPKIKKKLKR